MIGRTLAHYEIIEFVGAGGMGEVYRARDIRLGRNFEMMASPTSQEYVGRIVPSDNIVFMLYNRFALPSSRSSSLTG